MAIVHPFKGWLPKPEKAAEISSVPYDVINSEEASKLAEGKPDSFLHIIRPEIDLPEGTSLYADEVYEKGAENLQNLLKSDNMHQDEKQSFYIYQLETSNRKQTGVFACVSVEDYDNDIILKHELTRPDKEDDRTRHILTQSAHAEPVMLTFRDSADITFQMNKTMTTSAPVIEFQSDDGVWHRIWKITATADIAEAFSKIPKLYVADGHHRCKSASRVASELREKNSSFPGEAEYDYFPAVLFPIDQMEIMAYNRVIKKVTDKQFKELSDKLNLTEGASPEPVEKGMVSIYYSGKWFSAQLPEPVNDDVVANLDVARLQDGILSPLFGIDNPRTDKNIDFIGGIRGTKELERLVNNGIADLAFSMYPTAIEELVEVSDEGELMPPKSTWFEPKLRSGLIIHTF
jgi:uncharacterized protein (DUF1015 family)